MKIGKLKEIIKDMNNDIEIHIRNTTNPLGNISELEQVEVSDYHMFGTKYMCIILNTSNTSKELQLDQNGNYIELIES